MNLAAQSRAGAAKRLPAGASHTSDRGATLIEAALVLPLLITLVFGLAESGLAFKDWLTVGHAAREGVRVATAAGNDVRADIMILQTIEDEMLAARMDDVVKVEISDPQSLGKTKTNTYTWAPASTCGWSPCPDPDDLTYVPPIWRPQDRDVSAPITDGIAVSIVFEHHWVTGLFGKTSKWTNQAAGLIEPQVFET